MILLLTTLHNSLSGLAPRNLSPSCPWTFEGNIVIALKQMTTSSSSSVCPDTAPTGSRREGDAVQATSPALQPRLEQSKKDSRNSLSAG